MFGRDTRGTHRDEYFFTTDPSLMPTTVIGYDCGRWNIETTFQEARSFLGLESTCGWCAKTVLRAGPCLLGLYSVVALLFHALPEAKRTGGVAWPAGKATVTFSDALCAVRRWLWAETLLPQAGDATALQKLPLPIRELLLTTFAPAAREHIGSAPVERSIRDETFSGVGMRVALGESQSGDFNYSGATWAFSIF